MEKCAASISAFLFQGSLITAILQLFRGSNHPFPDFSQGKPLDRLHCEKHRFPLPSF
ncbi:hypothetical membrane protein [Syntrophus aciditrophicus SB]|uniref:Hypothetical membrane protein n=1 Tax=Syntrophus aciditrophicus (strain SB) TaxID=56780 RepID=Q2LWX6_SYNAS|nr:hypothetical membrane protein [Syntrophus aciditrophicus SB]